MAKVRNKTAGDKGAYLGRSLVMAAPGKTIEADDYPEDWFEVVEGADDAGASSEDITAAIATLNKDNDEHWTNAGLPSVDAVSDLIGRKVTRAEIEAAASDAKRPE